MQVRLSICCSSTSVVDQELEVKMELPMADLSNSAEHVSQLFIELLMLIWCNRSSYF